MASEPLSGEQSDAVKVSETPYPLKNDGRGELYFQTLITTS